MSSHKSAITKERFGTELGIDLLKNYCEAQKKLGLIDSDNPFYELIMNYLDQLDQETYDSSVFPLLQKGYLPNIIDACMNAVKSIDPITGELEWLVTQKSVWWYVATHSEHPSFKEFFTRIYHKDKELGDNAEKAVWDIPLHDLEVKTLEDKVEDLIRSAETELGLKRPKQVFDYGTGQNPSKLIPVIDALINIYGESMLEEVEYVLIERNPESLSKSLEILRAKYPNINLKPVNTTYELFFQSSFNDHDLNSNVRDDERIIAVSSNQDGNVQNDPLYFLKLLMPGIAIVTRHLIPEEDYNSMVSREPTDLILNMGKIYSSENVQNMGKGIIDAFYTDGEAIKNFGMCDPTKTMRLIHYNIGGKTYEEVSASPVYDFLPHDAPKELGLPRIDFNFPQDINYRFGILHSAKLRKDTYPKFLSALGCTNFLVTYSKIYQPETNGVIYPKELLGIYAFRTHDLSKKRVNINPFVI